MRIAAALLAAAAAAFLGSKILAEYPFDSFLPILGGALLGLAVTGLAALIVKDVPPVWMVGLTAAMAIGAEWKAVLVQRGPKGHIPWQGYAAIAAAAIGGVWRLRADLADRTKRTA